MNSYVLKSVISFFFHFIQILCIYWCVFLLFLSIRTTYMLAFKIVKFACMPVTDVKQINTVCTICDDGDDDDEM